MNTKNLRVAALVLLGLMPLSGCECRTAPPATTPRPESFRVEVKEVDICHTGCDCAIPPDTGPSCYTRYTSWSLDQPLPMPKVGGQIEVVVTALDAQGNTFEDFNRPVSFRITPGHLIAAGPTSGLSAEKAVSPPLRVLEMTNGVGHGFIWVDKVFGPATIWAVDAPPLPLFPPPADQGDDTTASLDGGQAESPDASGPTLDAGYPEVDGGRTYAAGVSDPIFFTSPTIADCQMLPGRDSCFDNPPTCSSPCGWNNKESPFINNYLTIDAAPPKGDMIVTAITAEGFYVADKLSPPISDPFYTSDATGFRVLPGTFGYIYVYNYNFPDGLYFADRVLSLTGTVQEFSGDTQLVFPSWVRKEDLNQHPEDLPAVVQLDFSNYNDTCPGYFTCANGGTGVPTSLRCLDQCGRAYMEPGQVCDTDSMMPTCTDDSCHAAMPGTHCDAASGSCLGCPQTPCPQGEWCVQRRCVNPNDPCSGPKCPDGERCNPTTGACECGPSLGYRISLTPTWKAAPAVGTFMQQLFAYSNNNVEIESLESAIVKVTNAMPPSVWVSCDANGNSSVPPFSWNVPTLPNGCPDWNNQGWYCYDSGDDTPDCYCNMQCTIGMKPYEFHGNNLCTELTSFRNFGQWQVELEPNWHTHINVMTRDALPDFDPRVFADPMYAGCRVDVTGVLRQVQAARTRWLILARDQNDVCCRAQPGGMCPTPDNGGFCPKCPDAHN